MDKQRCARCGEEEQIPTHQFVKFDLQVHYLCGGCWERFRTWFHRGRGERVSGGYGADAA